MFPLGTQMKMTLLLGLGLRLQGSGLIKPFVVVKTEYLPALSKLSGNGWGMWKQEAWQDQGPREHCPAHSFSKSGLSPSIGLPQTRHASVLLP